MKDPVFGNLEYEYGWNGTVEFNCFGRMEEIALTVSGEEDDHYRLSAQFFQSIHGDVGTDHE